MRYTVHQPMLFPPVYLVARFMSVRKLVWLDTDFAKTDGWHTRFKLQTKNGPVVIPIALTARAGKQIRDLEVFQLDRFQVKLEKTLHNIYGKEEQFERVLGFVQDASSEHFDEFCRGFMGRVFEYLGAAPGTACESALGIQKPEEASEWLVAIGNAINCTEYVCACDAPTKYLREVPFAFAGIKLEPQEYVMPKYDKWAEASNSILDLLMRCDREAVLKTLGG